MQFIFSNKHLREFFFQNHPPTHPPQELNGRPGHRGKMSAHALLRTHLIRAFELFVFEFIWGWRKISFVPFDDQEFTLNMDSTEKLNSSSELFSTRKSKEVSLF